MSTVLDAQTLELLESLNSFYVQQRFRWGEALTQGIWEQTNYYDVFDKTTKKRIMIIKEQSDTCSRICCAPHHSILLKYYHVGEDAPQHAPGEKIDWNYEPTTPAFMTMERGGCDCCGMGACPKPCLCCCVCSESCAEESKLYSGEIDGKPGEGFPQIRTGDGIALLGGTVQPSPGGGGITPTINIMERDAGGGGATTNQFAVTKGPHCFGGCSEFCCDSKFGVSTNETAAIGDYATITKKKPENLGQAAREALTDSDIYEIEFVAKEITPEQKANVINAMVHMDYMFFERNNDMCYTDGNGCHLVFFNCFCFGCICPCQCTCSGNGSS